MDHLNVRLLRSLEPERIRPFLTDRLRWRVQAVYTHSPMFYPANRSLNSFSLAKTNGQNMYPRILPGLKIVVSSNLSSVPVHAEPPMIEDYRDIMENIIFVPSREVEHNVRMAPCTVAHSTLRRLFMTDESTTSPSLPFPLSNIFCQYLEDKNLIHG